MSYQRVNEFPYKAVVVDANGIPPVKSNVDPSQPLRRKPPSEDLFRVTPGQPLYINNNRLTFDGDRTNSNNNYGVSNPHWFGGMNREDTTQPSVPDYGPTDFVVETVKLDKEFFHQFFTSKPLLLGPDVVTSTSVHVNKRKKGRDGSQVGQFPEAVEDEHSNEAPPSTGEALRRLQEEREQSRLQQMMQKFLNEQRAQQQQAMMTTTTPTTRLFYTTTTTEPTTTISSLFSVSKQSDIPIFDSNSIDISKSVNNNNSDNENKNVQTFRRYYLPPEVMITHQLAVPTSQETNRYLSDVEGGPRKAKSTRDPDR